MFQLAYKLAFETKAKKKKWDDIFALWYSAATSGHIRAQFYLATCYDDALDIKKNLRLAFEWYLKAAKAGHRDSQYNVGFFYGHNEFRNKNHKKKVYWYSKAANAGHIDAQRDLGYSYFYGEGVKRNQKQAVYCTKKLRQEMTTRLCSILVFVTNTVTV
jgi:uncharacterized protein